MVASSGRGQGALRRDRATAPASAAGRALRYFWGRVPLVFTECGPCTGPGVSTFPGCPGLGQDLGLPQDRRRLPGCEWRRLAVLLTFLSSSAPQSCQQAGCPGNHSPQHTLTECHSSGQSRALSLGWHLLPLCPRPGHCKASRTWKQTGVLAALTFVSPGILVMKTGVVICPRKRTTGGQEG